MLPILTKSFIVKNVKIIIHFRNSTSEKFIWCLYIDNNNNKNKTMSYAQIMKRFPLL